MNGSRQLLVSNKQFSPTLFFLLTDFSLKGLFALGWEHIFLAELQIQSPPGQAGICMWDQKQDVQSFQQTAAAK